MKKNIKIIMTLCLTIMMCIVPIYGDESETKDIEISTTDAIDFQEYKDSKIAELEIHANNMIDIIENFENLTEQDVIGYTDAVNSFLDQATKSIQNSTTEEEVLDYYEQAIVDINNVELLARLKANVNVNNEKTNAKQNLELYGNNAKQLVEDNSSLSDNEKKVAKEAIDLEVTKGKKAIDDADLLDEITAASNNAKTAIDAIVNGSNIETDKENAKEELRTYADEKIKAIKNNPNLSNKDKTDFEDLINGLVNTGNTNIENALDVPSLEKALSDAKQTIDTIIVDSEAAADTNLNNTKDSAKEALDKKGEEAKKAIDDNNDLTQSEKDKAKEDIEKIVVVGKDMINKTLNLTDTENEYNNSVKEINDIIAQLGTERPKQEIENNNDLKEQSNILPNTGYSNYNIYISLLLILVGTMVTLIRKTQKYT